MEELITTLAGGGATVSIATLIGLVRMYLKQKEKYDSQKQEMEKIQALQKREMKYLKEQCDSIKMEFDKLESKVENHKEEVVRQYNELKGELYEVSSNIKMILAIMENKNN